MAEKKSSLNSSKPSAKSERQHEITSPEEARALAALERARQNVKPIVKKEKESEVATAELLNLRLKSI